MCKINISYDEGSNKVDSSSFGKFIIASGLAPCKPEGKFTLIFLVLPVGYKSDFLKHPSHFRSPHLHLILLNILYSIYLITYVYTQYIYKQYRYLQSPITFIIVREIIEPFILTQQFFSGKLLNACSHH